MKRILLVLAVPIGCSCSDGTTDSATLPAGAGGEAGALGGAGGASGSSVSSGGGGTPGGSGGSPQAGASGSGGSPEVPAPVDGEWTSVSTLGCTLWHTTDAETLKAFPAPEWIPCPDPPAGWGCEMLTPPDVDSTDRYSLSFGFSHDPLLLQFGKKEGDYYHRVTFDLSTGKFREVFLEEAGAKGCALHPIGVAQDRSAWWVWSEHSDIRSTAIITVPVGEPPRVVKELPGPYVSFPDFVMVNDGVWEDMRTLWKWDGAIAQTIDLPKRATSNEVSDGTNVIWSEWSGSYLTWVYSWNETDGLSLVAEGLGVTGESAINKVVSPALNDGGAVWTTVVVEDTATNRGLVTLHHDGVNHDLGYIGWNTAGAVADCGTVAWAAQDANGKFSVRATKLITGKSAEANIETAPWDYGVPIGVTCEHIYFNARHYYDGMKRANRIVRLKPPLE